MYEGGKNSDVVQVVQDIGIYFKTNVIKNIVIYTGKSK